MLHKYKYLVMKMKLIKYNRVQILFSMIIKVLICLIISNLKVYSQSKKEQIEFLKSKIDSLNNVINIQSISKDQNELRYNNEISNLQIALKKSKTELDSKQQEINGLINRLNKKDSLILNFENQISVLKSEIEKLSLSSKLELIDPPFFSISKDDLISITDKKMIDPCPLSNVLGEMGPQICKKEIKKITYFKIGNIVRFFACVGYSFNGAHFDSGQNGYVLAEFKDSKWELLDFLQNQPEASWGNSLDVEKQFILGINSIGFFSQSCGTAQGFTTCQSYLVGFFENKISILLNEISSENNQGSGTKPIINWKFNYQPISSENKFYILERNYINLNKVIETKKMKYNFQSMKYE